jgi:hypothetical protein
MARPTGPLSRQRLSWHRQRCQARYRNEPWHIDFDAWWQLWQPYWDQRGMKTTEYCMIRQDDTQPWQLSNVLIVQRWEYLSTRGNYYKMQHRT